MKVTVTLENELGIRFCEAASHCGQSLEKFLIESAQARLEAAKNHFDSGFELITFNGGGVIDGVDLDRISELSD